MAKSVKCDVGSCKTCGHRTAYIINDGKAINPVAYCTCGMFMPEELFYQSNNRHMCAGCIHIGAPHWFNELHHRDEISKYSYACTYDISDKLHPQATKYFVLKSNKACIHYEDREDKEMAKQKYWTKCGRKFEKSSTASVTGYEVEEDKDGKIIIAQCAACPFLVEVKEGWPNAEHKRWECRAGSQPPNRENSWRGSLSDKNTIKILSLHHDFLESVLAFCQEHPDLSASYNQDEDDCRRAISVSCSSNKKGIAAKKELISKFFPSDAATAGQTIKVVENITTPCQHFKGIKKDGRRYYTDCVRAPQKLLSYDDKATAENCTKMCMGFEDQKLCRFFGENKCFKTECPFHSSETYLSEKCNLEKCISENPDMVRKEGLQVLEYCPMPDKLETFLNQKTTDTNFNEYTCYEDEFCIDCENCMPSGKGADHPFQYKCYSAAHRPGLEYYFDMESKACPNFNINKFFICNSDDCPFNDREGCCRFSDEDPLSEGYNEDVADAVNLHECKNEGVLNFYKNIIPGENVDPPVYKARCPYISSIGDKNIQCSLHSKFRGRHDFTTTKEVNDYSDSYCFCNFDMCETYHKIYQEEMACSDKNILQYRECAYCCNNSGSKDLIDSKKSGTHCFCQLHKKDVEKYNPDTVCDWFNRFYRPGETCCKDEVKETVSMAERLSQCPYYKGVITEGKKQKIKCGDNHYLTFENEEILQKQVGVCKNCYKGCRAYTRCELDRLGIDLGPASPQKTEHLISLLDIIISDASCCPNCEHLGAYDYDGYSEDEGTFAWSCKLGMQNAGSNIVCKNYKRKEDIKIMKTADAAEVKKRPRNLVDGVCEYMKEDCFCFCKHNDGCSIKIIKGKALSGHIEHLEGKGGIDCDVYRKIREIELSRKGIVVDLNTYKASSALQYKENDAKCETLDDSLFFIRTKSEDIINNYVAIGFTLIDIKENKLYLDKGYSSLVECVEAELNMKKSTCYNLIKISEEFGDPDTKQLKDEYKQFNYVQCLEMSTMPMKDRQLVTPDMSKREIKQIKNSNRLEKEIDQPAGQPEQSENNRVIEVTSYTVVDSHDQEISPGPGDADDNTILPIHCTENPSADIPAEGSVKHELKNDSLLSPEEDNKAIEGLYVELEQIQARLRDLEKERKKLSELVQTIDSKLEKLSKLQIKNALWNFITTGEINFDN